MAQKFKLLVGTGKDQVAQTIDIEQGAGSKANPVTVKAQAGMRYQLTQANSPQAPHNVRAKRVGKDLQVFLEDSKQADLVIQNYYDETPNNVSALVGQAENGTIYSYIPESANATGLVPNLADGGNVVGMALGNSEEFMLAAAPVAAAAAGGGLGLGILAVGLGAAALAGGKGGGGTTNAVAGAQGATPDVSKIVGIDAVNPVTGPLTNGGATNDTQPTFSGQATAGDVIKIYDGGKVIGTTTADSTGHWSWKPSTPLATGAHSLTFTDTPSGGTESAQSAPFNTTVDTGTTATITNAGQAGSQTPITGTGEPNATIVVKDASGTTIGTTTVDANGNWSVTPASALAAGGVIATATDGAGNSATANALTASTAAPATPAIITVSDNVGSVTGNLQKNDTTDDPTLTVSGTGTFGTTVKVYEGSTLVGSVDVGADGKWSLTTSNLGADGLKTLTAVAVNSANQTSAPTGPFPVTLDTTAPSKPATATATDDVGTVTGPIANNSTTDDATPTFSGTGTAGDTIKIYDGTGTTPLGTAVVDSTGHWSFTPSTPLSNARHSITTTASDPAGNTSAPSDPLTFTVDTSTVLVSVTKAVDNVGTTTDIANRGVTNDNTPTLVGTASPNAVVTIKEGNTTLGTATADPTGAWSYTPNSQTDGAHTYTAMVTNGASTSSATFSLTIDTIAPAAPASAPNASDDVGSIQGAIAANGVTDDTTPTFSGTGTPGEKITIYDGTTPLGTAIVDANGNWSYTPTTAMSEAAHSITTTTTDPAGNESAKSPALAFTIDITPPAKPSAPTNYNDNVAPVTNAASTAPSTNDNTPGINIGTLPADAAKAVLYVDGKVTPATYDPITGTLTPNSPIADGAHTLTYSLVDAAGNESAQSGSLPLTIDTSALGKTATITAVSPDTGSSNTDFNTNATALVFNGTLSSALATGEKVQISLDNGANWQDVTSVNGTTWSYDNSTHAMAQGAYTLQARVQAAGGNVGNATNQTLTIDTTAPTTPATAPTSYDDNAAPVINATSTAPATNDNTPGINIGALPTGATNVYLYVDGTKVAATYNPVTGTLTPNSPIADGQHNITYSLVDAAGNESGKSGALALNIDTSVPTLTYTSETSNNATSTLAKAGDTITVAFTSTDPVTSVTIDGRTATVVHGTGNNYTATYQVGSNDANGTADVVITAQDAAGNSTVLNQTGAVTVDTVAPTVTYTRETSSNATSTLAKAGDTITVAFTSTEPITSVTIDGKAATVVHGTGNNYTATYQVQSTDANGPANVVITAQDAAGNSTVVNQAGAVTVDTVAPTTTATITAISQDSGASATDFITNDQGLVFSGTLNTQLAAGEKVQISLDNGTHWQDATSVTGTSWTFDNQANNLTEGTYKLQARVSDTAGNGSSPTLHDLTIDTHANAPTLAVGSDGITVNLTGLEAGATWQYTLDGGNNWVNASTGSSSFALANGTTYAANQIEVRQTDLAGNQSSNPPGALGAITTPTLAGQATISLGSLGNLIAPVKVEGHWYYFLDTNNSMSADTGDMINHDVLDAVFKYDQNGNANPGSVGVAFTDLYGYKTVGGDTNPTYRYATLNGVKLALPNAGEQLDSNGLEQASTGNANAASGTSVNNGYMDNPSYNDFFAIWDAYSTVSGPNPNNGLNWVGAPSGWAANAYWTAQMEQNFNGLGSGTRSHYLVNLYTGTGYSGISDPNIAYAAIEVLDNKITIDSINHDTGASATDFVTNNQNQVFSGSLNMTLAAGDKVQVSLDNGATWHDATSTTATGWTYDNSANTLAQGTYQVQAHVINTSTNIVSTATTHQLYVDITAPVAPTDTLATNRVSINVTGLEANPYTTWEYSTDHGAHWTTGTGTSFNLPQLTTYAAGDVETRQTDLAGNVSNVTQMAAFTTSNNLNLGSFTNQATGETHALSMVYISSYQGKNYYYIDGGGDGSATEAANTPGTIQTNYLNYLNGGALPANEGLLSGCDKITHDWLDAWLNNGNDTTVTARSATINGHTVILPTAAELTAAAATLDPRMTYPAIANQGNYAAADLVSAGLHSNVQLGLNMPTVTGNNMLDTYAFLGVVQII